MQPGTSHMRINLKTSNIELKRREELVWIKLFFLENKDLADVTSLDFNTNTVFQLI